MGDVLIVKLNCVYLPACDVTYNSKRLLAARLRSRTSADGRRITEGLTSPKRFADEAKKPPEYTKSGGDLGEHKTGGGGGAAGGGGGLKESPKRANTKNEEEESVENLRIELIHTVAHTVILEAAANGLFLTLQDFSKVVETDSEFFSHMNLFLK